MMQSYIVMSKITEIWSIYKQKFKKNVEWTDKWQWKLNIEKM